MASRAPTYYHWSMDKPCTTNQTYGFELKGEMQRYAALAAQKPSKKLGPMDYTRPFSNIGFFPKISGDKPSKSTDLRSRKSYSAPARIYRNSFESCKKINQGYIMGHVPVTAKIRKHKYPVDVAIMNFQAVPPEYVRRQPKEKEIFLWHSLAGCLVHAKTKIQDAPIQKEVY